MAYFWYGLALVIIYAVIVVYYYSRKRHKRVEEAKYKMLHDEEEF